VRGRGEAVKELHGEKEHGSYLSESEVIWWVMNIAVGTQ